MKGGVLKYVKSLLNSFQAIQITVSQIEDIIVNGLLARKLDTIHYQLFFLNLKLDDYHIYCHQYNAMENQQLIPLNLAPAIS